MMSFFGNFFQNIREKLEKLGQISQVAIHIAFWDVVGDLLVDSLNKLTKTSNYNSSGKEI